MKEKMAGSFIDSFLFRPPEHVEYILPTNVFTLTTARNERIAATHIRRRGVTTTVLFSHGNAQDLNLCYPFLRRLSRRMNVNVVAYDYSGYGASTGSWESSTAVFLDSCLKSSFIDAFYFHFTGTPSEENCYADVDAVFQYLIQSEGLDCHDIILYGRSLGSGPSCYLASRYPVGGLILHSPFASVYRVILNIGLTLPGDKFSNIDCIRRVRYVLSMWHCR